MFCKKCGADIGKGYPEVRFCVMCGVDLAPKANDNPNQYNNIAPGNLNSSRNEEVAYSIQNSVPNNWASQPSLNNNYQFVQKRDRFSFVRRVIPVKAVILLAIGTLLCIFSLFTDWIAPYNDSKTFSIPRTQDTYKRNQYGDLTSIETRRWYDTYKYGGSNSGVMGIEMDFGSIAFLVLLGIGTSIFFKVNGLPYWKKWMPAGAFIYLILFIVSATSSAIGSQGGPDGGILIFLIGMVLLFWGYKSVRASQ